MATFQEESSFEEAPATGLLQTSNTPSPRPAVSLREEEVQNAVNFLTHPKVLGSTAGAKRSFLKNKGLTDEEIDEGFSRAAKLPPAPPAPPASAPSTIATAVGDPAAANASHTSVPAVSLQPVQSGSWASALFTVGLVAASAYGLGTLVAPWVKRWWTGESAQDQDDRVLKLLDAMNKKQEDLDSKVSGVASTVQILQTRSSQSAVDDVLQDQLKTLQCQVQRISTTVADTTGLSQDIGEIKALLQASTSGGISLNSPEVTSKPRHGAIVTSPGSLSSMGIHRSTAGAGAATPYPSPSSAANMPYAFQSSPPAPPYATPAAPGSAAADGVGVSTFGDGEDSRHPPDYFSILKMLEQGQTPPGVRADINDKPPFPDAEPTPSEVARRPKPWERQHAPSAGASAPWLASSQTAAPVTPSVGLDLDVPQDAVGSSKPASDQLVVKPDAANDAAEPRVLESSSVENGISDAPSEGMSSGAAA